MGDRKPSGFVDEILEASLARYGSEDPRPGLEARILANVRAAEKHSQSRIWGWGIALAAAVILIVAIVYRPSRRTPSPTVPAPVATNPAATVPAVTVGPAPQEVQEPAHPARIAKVRRPRPEQFPTPAPLSEQEKLLLLYVRETPKSVLNTPVTDPATDDLQTPDLIIAALANNGPEAPQK